MIACHFVALDVIRNLAPPLHRGGRLDLVVSDRRGNAYMKSFAGIYVLLLRYPGHFDGRAARQSATRALGAIEALTTSLPQTDGPGAGGAEGFGSA